MVAEEGKRQLLDSETCGNIAAVSLLLRAKKLGTATFSRRFH